MIKKDKSIIKKNRKKHKMVLFAKSKLNSINVLIFKALTDSDISLDESIIINNVLKEFHDIKKKKIKILIKNKKFKLYMDNVLLFEAKKEYRK